MRQKESGNGLNEQIKVILVYQIAKYGWITLKNADSFDWSAFHNSF